MRGLMRIFDTLSLLSVAFVATGALIAPRANAQSPAAPSQSAPATPASDAPTSLVAAEPLNPEAAPVHFRVVVDAPKPYEKMLEDGLDLVRWQNDQRQPITVPVLERLVEEARKAAAEALAADGYFKADVQTRIDRPSAKEAVVHIAVKPGTRTVVKDVDLQFRGPVLDDGEGRKRIDLIRQTWGLPPGEPFRQGQWDEAKIDALKRLGRGRYAAASIAESEARVDPQQHRADLRLKLDSGPVFHAGPTIVSGLRRYPPSVVENLNPMKPGEPYDATKLDLFQRALLRTGYFNAVNFAIDPDPAQADAAPLQVAVIEAPSQRIDTGIALSTDTRLGVTVDYTNANMFDSAWRFHPQLKLNAKEQAINAAVDSPPRPGGVWDTYSAKIQRRDIAGLVTQEAVVGYAYNWGLEQTPSQLVLAGHFEHQAVAGSTTENNYALYAGYRRVFRTTEDLVSPRRGVLGTFEIGGAVPGINTRDFGRVRGKISWLIPAGLRNDFLIRGEAGVVLATSRIGIPSFFLFRTGGDQTVRGYAYESLGVPQGEAIVGGRYLAVASAEYTRWVTESLGAAVFVDAGDAFDQLNAFDPAVGVGVGVRYRSPIGPLRADVAYGERTKRVRLHFSVGFNF